MKLTDFKEEMLLFEIWYTHSFGVDNIKDLEKNEDGLYIENAISFLFSSFISGVEAVREGLLK